MEENVVNRIYEDIQKSNEPKRYWLYGVSGRYMKAVEVCNKLKIKPYIKFVERAWDKYVEPESGKNEFREKRSIKFSQSMCNEGGI